VRVTYNVTREGHIYLISDGEFLKIGWTKNVILRREVLQCGNVRELTVLATKPGSQLTEGAIHKALRKYRVRGEWFKMAALRQAKEMLRDD
jgi:T5orf172 domain